jgi:hypothetical protein
MTMSSALQISLISEQEWSCLFSRFALVQTQFKGKARSLSVTLGEVSTFCSCRRLSDVSDLSDVEDAFSETKITLWDSLPSKVKED